VTPKGTPKGNTVCRVLHECCTGTVGVLIPHRNQYYFTVEKLVTPKLVTPKGTPQGNTVCRVLHECCTGTVGVLIPHRNQYYFTVEKLVTPKLVTPKGTPYVGFITVWIY
jgi:DNA polymerase II small subunit/DNA polymerase delta subunit B